MHTFSGDDASASQMRLAIGIPTRRRPSVLAETLHQITHQTRKPDRVIVCATDESDVEMQTSVAQGIEVLFGSPGLPHQRNLILQKLDDCDIVLFLDDDFLMASRYVENTLAALQSHPDLVATTGVTIADGSRGPGVSVEAARALIAADDIPGGYDGFEPAPHGYGCNMALRLSTIRQYDVRFDERLPLYAWSEDVDFTHRLARHGWIAKIYGARGVHLGTKQGRTPGQRLGYSQVANPIYLFHKGSYSFGRTARSVGRNLAANVARSLHPEPYIDRRGRLRGNGLAFLDLLRGRLTPERILDL
jgi:glycosyltransferase involved in cell wall biosynthesis